MGDSQLFDALGVGLGLPESYAIALALKKLGEDPKRGVATVRFFGKFFGLYADYYVFETTLKEAPEMAEAPGGWRGGVGGVGSGGEGGPGARGAGEEEERGGGDVGDAQCVRH